MKREYWIVIGIAVVVLAGITDWIEGLRANSQDVTISELVLPRPTVQGKEIQLLKVLNDEFQAHDLDEMNYFQGFQAMESGNRIVAGNFSYSQIGKVRRQLVELSQKSPEVFLTPVFDGRVRFHRPLEFRADQSLKLIGEPGETPIEVALDTDPDHEPLTAHFYDGHTTLFAKVSDKELRILFITVITPPESTFQKIVDFFQNL